MTAKRVRVHDTLTHLAFTESAARAAARDPERYALLLHIPAVDSRGHDVPPRIWGEGEDGKTVTEEATSDAPAPKATTARKANTKKE